MAIEIDHVVIAGKDLSRLCAIFEAIGLTPDPGGVHADGQTHNALIGFADGSYLELIAPTPGNSAPQHAWSAFMNTDAGVCAWALRSTNIEADVALYRSRGIPVGEPISNGRTRPDGVRLEWITVKMGQEPLGSVLPFLIQDITAREWRMPRTQSANGFVTGIAKVVMNANPAYQELLASAFGPMNVAQFQQINHTIGDRGQGVQGVVLTTPDLELARQRYEVGENAMGTLGSISLGFSAPT